MRSGPPIPVLAGVQKNTDVRAINCTPRVADYIAESIAPNTKRAYLSDLAQFAAWGGAIPCTAETVAAYVADKASTLGVATLRRRLAAIAKAHRLAGASNPTSAEVVRATMQGIQRTHVRDRKEATPLLKEELFAVLDALGSTTKDIRDRAVLLLGWAGAFRRSEIVSLDLNDVVAVRQGLSVTLRRSKTDQIGAGRLIGIPHGRSRHCPVRAFEAWVRLRGEAAGPLFYSVEKGGAIRRRRLPDETVSEIVQHSVARAGLAAGRFSGHSLRAGFVTSCAAAGIASWRIRMQSGHRSENTLARYIRRGELFLDNPASALL